MFGPVMTTKLLSSDANCNEQNKPISNSSGYSCYLQKKFIYRFIIYLIYLPKVYNSNNE